MKFKLLLLSLACTPICAMAQVTPMQQMQQAIQMMQQAMQQMQQAPQAQGAAGQQAPQGGAMRMCAPENGPCNATGMNVVAYGANNSWNVKTVTGAFTCNNATFGDPIYGTVKSCLVAPLASIKAGANENGSFTLPAGKLFAVVYGVDTRWAGKSYPAGTPVSCSNATFGDPAYGTVKSCGFVAIN